ncbi:dethiobiotin synthase [Mycobacterium sp.]|uniref:dethiobiotin synthase n=1 Tax=Mycobacterium sp. TaxID=1785 RepID=UPI002BA54205|nr:dethiobiotin synthase [Mycobacterium sp.]HME49984.1 dethiobiotin synthase [Mycobacterium sp.]
MSVLVITGTGTGVGKTVATAALASRARQAGIDVAVCKPVQTGTAAGDDDLAEVRRLSGADNVVGSWRYPEPLAPVAAAQLSAVPLPSRVELDVFVRAVDRSRQLTFVEGAGGLLVELGSDGTTLRELAIDLHAPVLVVTTPELGTLNHTALTLEALAREGISCAGLVIGRWPGQPGVVEESNREALGRLAPLRAVLPAGASTLSADEFARMSAAEVDAEWLTGLVA